MNSVDHRRPRVGRDDNIVLIGMRASGKTTAGIGLAERLGRTFVDLDDRLAARLGRSVDEVLAQDGEELFRAQEQEVLKDAVRLREAVIATGGGAVLHAAAFAALAETGIVVYLEASVEVLVARGRTRGRPPLTARDARAEVQFLLENRRALYEEAAQIKIHTASGDPILAIVEALDLA
jgi:shikimate kinase